MHRLREPDRPLRLTWQGRAIAAAPGESVAAALLANGIRAFRKTPAGTPRGPFCMMGACFDCLVEIDGVPGRQACMTEAREGMALAPQQGAAGPGDD